MFDKKLFKSTKVDGVLSVKYDDKEAYGKGTDIPLETLEQVSEYNSKYALEATEAAVAYSKSQLKKDEEVNKVIVEFPYSTSEKGELTVTVDREKTFRNPQKEGETITRPAIAVKVKEPAVILSKSKIASMVDDLSEALSK